MPKSGETQLIDLNERYDIHCKAYIPKSLDVAIKVFQTSEIENTGNNVTYSEAVRRLILQGLNQELGVYYLGRENNEENANAV